MVTIIDYGMGNLGSIVNMFKRVGVPSIVTSDLDEISAAKKLLLPGVGAFDSAMERINTAGMRPILDQKALEEKIPILGICLGMQLLTNGSEEGKCPGFGWIEGETKKFQLNKSFKVPHMGWNSVIESTPSQLTKDFAENTRFYFVHSYYVTVNDPSHSIMKTRYGIEFDSAIQKNNLFGAQFHPEKSHRFGLQFLRNFAAI